ncbi:hypothetical protein ABZP36_030415 [Zizania latifolia]
MGMGSCSSSSNNRAAPAPTPAPLPSPPATMPPLHTMDADADDVNVKQLNECAALYLSLQAPPFPALPTASPRLVFSSVFPHLVLV